MHEIQLSISNNFQGRPELIIVRIPLLYVDREPERLSQRITQQQQAEAPTAAAPAPPAAPTATDPGSNPCLPGPGEGGRDIAGGEGAFGQLPLCAWLSPGAAPAIL